MVDQTDHLLEQALAHAADVPRSLHFHQDRLEQIRRRARRRQRTRTAGAMIGVATVGVIATVAVGAVLPTPTGDSTATGPSAPGQAGAQPAPWSEAIVAEDSVGPVFSVPGTAYLIKRDSIGALSWTAASGKVAEPSTSCVFVKGDGLFSTMQADCFDSWDGVERAAWTQFGSDTAQDGRVLVGAVDTSAREVQIAFADGSQKRVDAVATPTSKELRFFALGDSGVVAVRAVTPIGGDGTPAAAPEASDPQPPCDGDCPTPPS